MRFFLLYIKIKNNMKRLEKIPKQVKNFIKTNRVMKPLYTYRVDGIYVNFGPLEGKNISKMYIENNEIVESFIENIIYADEAPLRIVMDTFEVYKDLKNNYYKYEL
jgi:hypothetical protein